MFLLDQIQEQILNIVRQLYPEIDKSTLEKIVLESAKDPSHGDLSTNAAMVLAKPLKQSPITISKNIIDHLQSKIPAMKVQVAGPGFINLFLPEKYWYEELKLILKLKEDYGTYNLGKDKKVNVEFLSANPTGPLHIGHARIAILGDVIGDILNKVGFQVTKEYYVNDAGGQVIQLSKSLYLRYKELLGIAIKEEDFDQDMYKGKYLVDIAKKLIEIDKDKWLTKPIEEWLLPLKKFAVKELLEQNKKDLEVIGINIDIYTHEIDIIEQGFLDQAIKKLQENNDIYVGTLQPPKGLVVGDWEERPQLLFRSTKYGDDIDRPLQKSDNSWTYFAGDIAYHYQKIQRNFDNIIDVLGADHCGYIKRVTAAVRALNSSQDITIKVSQFVNFLDNGEPIRMSKRSGNFVTMHEAVDKVGKEAIRFMMVSRHQDMPIDFDFAKLVEQNKDNFLFYIQYAHARIHSVIRHSKNVFPQILDNDLNDNDFSLLTDVYELAMIKLLANYPRQIKVAAVYLEPHRLANYMYELASAFHAFWNKGKDNNQLRFINADDFNLTKARIGLITGVSFIIAGGLRLLGIQPLEEMR